MSMHALHANGQMYTHVRKTKEWFILYNAIIMRRKSPRWCYGLDDEHKSNIRLPHVCTLCCWLNARADFNCLSLSFPLPLPLLKHLTCLAPLSIIPIWHLSSKHITNSSLPLPIPHPSFWASFWHSEESFPTPFGHSLPLYTDMLSFLREYQHPVIRLWQKDEQQTLSSCIYFWPDTLNLSLSLSLSPLSLPLSHMLSLCLPPLLSFLGTENKCKRMWWCPCNMLVHLRDRSAQASVHAKALRQKLQIKLSSSPSHSILILGQPAPVLTL